jgi:nicotinate-nucleotide adenylyltransferase
VRPAPRRIGVLGGTFDPIHSGHLDMAEAAARALNLTRIYVITANFPPHRGQPQASSFHRFAMVSMAVAGRPGWRASDLELRTSTTSYTSDTLKMFHQREYAPCELFFVLGSDAFAEVATWRDYPSLLDAAHFVVVSRPGLPVGLLSARLPQLADRMVRPPIDAITQIDPVIILIEAPTADVSSTAIRERRAHGLSIGGMVPPFVQQHIEQHGLYTAMGPGRRGSDAPRASEAGRLHGEN